MLNGIANIDERHDKMSDIYKIFSLFQSFLGRPDIGMIATNNDLQTVREYIDTMTIMPFNEEAPLARPVLICYNNGVNVRGEDIEWNWGMRCNGDHHA